MIQRNQSIDILKGIGMLFVLSAHALEGTLSTFAYTFHIPMFFIISGLFLKPHPTLNENQYLFITTWNNFKRLLYPVFFTTIAILLISLFSKLLGLKYSKYPIELLSVDDCNSFDSGITILGNMWFLFVLFYSKTFAQYALHFYKNIYVLFAISFILGSIACFSLSLFVIPLRFQSGIMMIPYIFFGYYIMQKYNIYTFHKTKLGIFLIILWLLNVFYFHIEMTKMFSINFYFIFIIMSIGGTIFFYLISQLIYKHTKYIAPFLSFIGTYSIILICAPTIETYCFPMQEIIPSSIPMHKIYIIGGKVIWCILAVFICLKVHFLKKIFVVK